MPEEIDNDNLESMFITKLKEMAKEKGIKNYSKMNKAELLKELDQDKIMKNFGNAIFDYRK